mmetsp:Transcript_2428/g.6061  ORF Transcript_2428/g.6061 Transcript_2428/m.6061 type:complete len:690 (+) Transcript_2428:62-2131(+)
MGSEVDGDEDESLFDALANNPVLNALRRYKETAGTSYMTSSVLEPISETSVVNLNDPYHSAKADWERQLRAHLVNEGGFDQGSEMNNRGDFPFQIQCGNFTRSEYASELQSEVVFGQLERHLAGFARCGPVSDMQSDYYGGSQLQSQLAEGVALQDLVAGRCGIVENSQYGGASQFRGASQLQSTYLIDDGTKNVQCGGMMPFGPLFGWLAGMLDPATKDALGISKVPICGGGSTLSSYGGSGFQSGLNTQRQGAAGGQKKDPSGKGGAFDLPSHPRMQQAGMPEAPVQDNGLLYADIAKNGLDTVALEQVREAPFAITADGPGLGRVVVARMLSPRLGPSKFGLAWISELRVSREPEPEKVKALDNVLKEWSQCLKWPSLCRPLGVMAAKLEAGTHGIWFAWSEPLSSSGPVIAPGQKPTDAVSLREALCVQPPLGLEWRLHVARRLCETLEALHASGNSHGSLAPRSIWVSAMGEVSITEAGISDGLLDAGIYHRDELLAYLGLEFARYLAPEGWRYAPGQNIAECGVHKDMWALGLIFLELLAGAEPANIDCSKLAQLSAKIQKPPSVPRAGADGWLRDLPLARQMITRCLSMRPTDRPSAREVSSSLVVQQPRPEPEVRPRPQQPEQQPVAEAAVAQPPAPAAAPEAAPSYNFGFRPRAPAPARTALSEASGKTSISFVGPYTGH